MVFTSVRHKERGIGFYTGAYVMPSKCSNSGHLQATESLALNQQAWPLQLRRVYDRKHSVSRHVHIPVSYTHLTLPTKRIV